MHKALQLPELGDPPPSRLVLSYWFVRPGEWVDEGDPVLELLSNGITFSVPAPFSGVLIQQEAFPPDELQIGQVLGIFDDLVSQENGST